MPSDHDHAPAPVPRFLAGGGAATDLILARDWTGHPLGPPDTWPETLRVALGIVLNSPESMILAWGPDDLHFFFNETYFPLLGPRLPWAMGARFDEVWVDGLDQAMPIIADAFAGRATRYVDLPWRLATDRGSADTWWTFSYSRVVDGDGEVVGLFIVTNETTDQVLANRRAAAEQERQRALLSHMPGFVGVLQGPDHVFDYVNDAYREIAGRRDYLGRPIRDVFPDLSGQGIFELLDSVYASGERINRQARPVRLAGETRERFVDMVYEPMRDEAGAVTGIFVGGYDVTERVRAEAALRSQEARHGQILDSLTDHAVIASGLDARITHWNEGAERIFGWRAAEMLGQTADRFFTPEDRARGQVENEMRAARETGRGTDERWHLRQDDSRFWASGAMMPLVGGDGTLDGYVKVLRDRTAERRQEQRLSLLAQISAGLLDADDPDAVLGPVLEQSTELLGFEESYSYVLTPDCEHLHLTHSVGASREVRAALVSASFDLPICGIVAQTRAPVVIANLQATTEPRYAVGRACGYDAFAAFPVMSGDKLHGVMSFAARGRAAFDDEALAFFATLARYVAVVRSRLDFEAALLDAADTLERRVAERTQELARSQEALQQAQKMEAVGQLTGGVAHDFNNLLTVIRGSVDLLRRPGLSDERRTRYVDAIADTADRAAKLTAQLLAFARRQSLQPEVFDAGASIAKIADMVGTLSGPRIAIVTRLPEEPCLIDADPSQFDTSMVNLAINARDAMNGEGTVTISVAAVAGVPAVRERPAIAGAFVAVAVRDTGTGIDPADLHRIFEPFFTTKDVGKGTGLGLSQVFGFARQSGGEIVVASVPGRGTTFTLYLPRADRPAAVAATPDPQATAEGGGTCVLLVEDNADVGDFATQALQELGYDTVWAADGRSALAELDRGADRFHIVFSDVVMPGMSGIELGREIRRRYGDLPVVLTSGYSDVLVEHGSDGFDLLRKPYSVEQLSLTLRRAARGAGDAG